MDFEIKPVTEAGARLAKLCEDHAVDFATRAADHDRENTYVSENIAALIESGVAGAVIPEEHGGLGVESLHDLAVAVNRLARGCPSTAISINMHMSGLWNMVKGWRDDVANGETERAARLESMLGMAGKVVTSGLGTEAGTSLPYVQTTATRTEGGWLLNGQKIFGTNSEMASAFMVFARGFDEEGVERMGGGFVFAGTPGLTINRDWDALGMRGSGSHSSTLENVFVPEGMLQLGAPMGEFEVRSTCGLFGVNFPLLGAYVGIAEAAASHVIDLCATRRKKPSNRLVAERHTIQHAVGEMVTTLSGIRAALDRTALHLDDYLVARSYADMTVDELMFLFADWQSTKSLVTRGAVEVVDRAMAISGGSGYLTSSPLSRLYRDVRAGAFHQPLNVLDAPQFIGQVSLGQRIEFER